jgi:hypothetical protein
VQYGDVRTKDFSISLELPQGSTLSSFLFIVFHSDLIQYTGAFSTHIFADDLNVLIRAPIEKKLEPMMQFLEQKDTKVSNKLFGYAKLWKQPINISKSVYQVFHTQVTLHSLTILMNNTPLQCVNDFKYLGYTWTSKLSMRKSVANCLEKVQRSYTKLKWLKYSKVVSISVLRRCFFAWLFCFFPFLPSSHQELIRQKFTAGLKLVHRCPWTTAHELHNITNEKGIDYYVKVYIKKRLKKICKSNLSMSQSEANVEEA